jgi:hypothetical protein
MNNQVGQKGVTRLDVAHLMLTNLIIAFLLLFHAWASKNDQTTQNEATTFDLGHPRLIEFYCDQDFCFLLFLAIVRKGLAWIREGD